MINKRINIKNKRKRQDVVHGFHHFLISTFKEEEQHKPFSCSKCNTNATGQESPEGMRESFHGEKPFSCAKCGMKFRFTTNLKNRQTIHTGEQPFICSMYEGKFRDSIDLKRHNSHS